MCNVLYIYNLAADDLVYRDSKEIMAVLSLVADERPRKVGLRRMVIGCTIKVKFT